MVTVAGSSYGLNHLMNVRVGRRGRREGLPGGGSSTRTFGRGAPRRVDGVEEEDVARLGAASGSPRRSLGRFVMSRGGSGCSGSGGGGRWWEISPGRSSRAKTGREGGSEEVWRGCSFCVVRERV